MDKKFLKEQEAYFLKLMDDIRNKMSNFTGAKLTDGDVVDQCHTNDENDKNIKLNKRMTNFLRKITHSLSQIENNTYGTCTECECDISKDRLQARPTATLCIDCKEAQEAYERCTHKNRAIHQLAWVNVSNKMQ